MVALHKMGLQRFGVVMNVKPPSILVKWECKSAGGDFSLKMYVLAIRFHIYCTMVDFEAWGFLQSPENTTKRESIHLTKTVTLMHTGIKMRGQHLHWGGMKRPLSEQKDALGRKTTLSLWGMRKASSQERPSSETRLADAMTKKKRDYFAILNTGPL